MQQHTTDNPSQVPRGVQDTHYWSPERISAAARNVLIVIGAGIVLGIFAATSNLYYVAAAITAAILVILVAWQFEAALTIYILVAFLPWGRTPDLAVGGSGVGKGVYVSEAMLGFLLVVWAGRYLLGSLPKQRIRSGFYLPMGLYLAYCVLNVVHSYLFWDPHVSKAYQHPSVNVIELGVRFLSIGALVVMATTVSSQIWLRRMMIALMLAGAYNAANALTGMHIPLQAPWWPLVALLPATYACAIALDGTQPLIKRLCCAGVVLVLIFLILVKSIGWVSGWLGLLVALGTVLFIANKKAFVIAALIVCVAGAVAWPFFHSNVVQTSQEEGDYDRFAMLSGSWKYATAFPLGVGLGNYRTYNSFYYGNKWGTTSYTSAHGTYSQALSETGIPGLVLLCAILLSGFSWLLTSYRDLPHGLAKLLVLAALGQMAGIAAAAFVGDYIIPSYHNGGLVMFSATVYSWLVWGLVTAQVRLAQKAK